MKNRILSITRRIIPYVPELMPLAHTIPGCIIMQQLDFWFERQPNGFYKFIKPCAHPLYADGQSWVEETGMSDEQFIRNFSNFGIRYSSKTAFEQAPDKFQGKFYCSYTDKRAQLTYWYRNHEAIDAALDQLIHTIPASNTPSNSGNNGDFSSQNGQKPSFFTVDHGTPTTGNRETRSTVKCDTRITGSGITPAPVIGTSPTGETTKPGVNEPAKHVLPNTETEEKQRLQPQDSANTLGDEQNQNRGGGLHSENQNENQNLIFPARTLVIEKETLLVDLQKVEFKFRQQILDEVEGAIRSNSLKKGIVVFGRFLVNAVLSDQFEPRLGIEVQGAREKLQDLQDAELSKQANLTNAISNAPMDKATYDKLPPNIKAKIDSLNKSRAGG